MQKVDIYNHQGRFEKWNKDLTPNYIEDGLTKANSKLFIDYFKHLSRTQSIGHVNRCRSKIKSIFIGLQKKKIKDITKITDQQANDYFLDWIAAGHSIDYVTRFKSFWNWWKKENRRKGKVIQDIILDLKDFQKGSQESNFVWLNKSEFDKFRSYFDQDKQTILLFMFDSLIRCPTELLSLKVENISQKDGEVWINIPTEISKTIGRKFNLIYSGKAILEYIQRNNKQPTDYLFTFSPIPFNNELKRIAKQLFGDQKSEGGEFFKNISMYDFRHSGAIHFRQIFSKTGQSLDLLRERGGWANFKMIDYYTKRLGLTGHIEREKLVLEEDKTKSQTEIEEMKKQIEKLSAGLQTIMALGYDQRDKIAYSKRDPIEEEIYEKVRTSLA